MDEYSKVEEDDGEFGESDEEFIDDLTSVPELEDVLALIMRNMVAKLYHYCFSKIERGKVDSVVSEAILYSCRGHQKSCLRSMIIFNSLARPRPVCTQSTSYQLSTML